jgi:hypothetical protein
VYLDSYLTDFLCQAIGFVAELEIHLVLICCLVAIVQLHDVLMEGALRMYACFLLRVLPCLLREQFFLQKYLFDDVLQS